MKRKRSKEEESFPKRQSPKIKKLLILSDKSESSIKIKEALAAPPKVKSRGRKKVDSSPEVSKGRSKRAQG